MKELWEKFLPRIPMTKRNMFIAILILIGALSVVGSFIAKIVFLDRPEGKPLHIGLVMPTSGVDVSNGKAMRQGLQLALDELNREGGINDRPVDLVVYDESKVGGVGSEFGKKISGDEELVAIVGPWSADKVNDVAEVAAVRHIPVIVPSSVSQESVTEHDNVFSTLFDVVWQTRFLANYNRNVVGEKTASVIYADNDQGKLLFQQFDKTYRRFGTRVLNSWAYDASEPDSMRKRADGMAAEIKDKKISGTIFVQGNVGNSAAIVVALRDKGVRNPIIGLSDMATDAFIREISRWADDGKTAADYLNGTMVTTPLLFDTATEVAQTFRSAFVEANGSAPDWPAAFSYDAGKLAISAMRLLMADLRKASREDREKAANSSSLAAAIYDHISGLNRPEVAEPAAGGLVYFGKGGKSAMPVQMGLYNGSSMISALTQLQPITEGGVSGYLDLLKQGKVLYVNDGFMYRTNVVYTGVQLQDVQELNVNDNTVKLEFLVWFRYRGDFAPEDIVFENSLEPIKLEQPIREGKTGDMIYKAYRVEGDFNLNFTLVEREYGSELIGLSFHHRVLSKNNLMYVTDVLGMGLASNQTLLDTLQESVTGEGSVPEAQVEEAGRLQDLADTLGQGDAGGTLLNKLLERQVLAPLSGWEASHAWISQELLHGSSEGDPSYVGYGKPAPDFSQINFGMVLKPERIEARDFIPANWFVYVVISSVIAIFFAMVMDHKDRGQFWRMQTLLLRAVGWPALLLAGGALVLDYSVSHLNESTVDIVVATYESLWWLIPARILVIAIERFIWVPLEIRTERKIPNVIRAFAAGTIYLLAVFSVLAFVFDQKLTSLLATSGLLAMIIGLAIQANIANIFSGIVLNIERPFKVGDWIELGDETMPAGAVDDITWRTTRLVTVDGYSISVPNAQVSESKVVNYTFAEKVRIVIPVYTDVDYDPSVVIPAIKRGLASKKDILFCDKDGNAMVASTTSGTEVVERDIYSRYVAIYWIKASDYAKRYPIQGQCMTAVWKSLEDEGIQYKKRSPGTFYALPNDD